MKLENQITNLELSKKLKELGVKQNSAFYWFETDNHSNYFLSGVHTKEVVEKDKKYCIKKGLGHYSAYTVAELGEMLPKGHWFKTIFFSKRTKAVSFDWETPYRPTNYYSVMENTEANARAKMLIYLIKNSLIKI